VLGGHKKLVVKLGDVGIVDILIRHPVKPRQVALDELGRVVGVGPVVLGHGPL